MDREPTRAVAPTRARPSAAVYRRRRLSVLAAATAVLLLVATHGHSGGARAAKGAVPDVAATGTDSPRTPPHRRNLVRDSPLPWLSPSPAGTPSGLAPGSDPSVLPGPILIADKGNNRLLVVDPSGRVRWQWPQPGDLAPGQSFPIPDDAFFTPDGRNIIATEEDVFAITEINIASRKIVWRYGRLGVSGSAPGYLWNPDDAMMLRDGSVVAADIKNCRVIELPPGGTAPSWQEGGIGQCWHNPPYRFGSPNGLFPLTDGNFLATEINGDWVDELDLRGNVAWSTHPPGVAYPSDSNQIGADRYLTVDYSNPGQVVVFDRMGTALWRWAPTGGPGALNQPSLAMVLPNGDILLTDDHNDRVIVIDPRSNSIVWQYGHTGVAGRAAGYLDTPDGLDPLPPYSYADRYQR